MGDVAPSAEEVNVPLLSPWFVLAGGIVGLLSAALTARGAARHARDGSRSGWYLLMAGLASFGAARLIEAGASWDALPPWSWIPARFAMLGASVAGTLGLARVVAPRLVGSQRSVSVDAIVVTVASTLALWHHMLVSGSIVGIELVLAAATLTLQAGVAAFFLRLLLVAGNLAAARWLTVAGFLAAAGSFLYPLDLGAAGAVATEVLWTASLPAVALASLQPSMRALSLPGEGQAAVSERFRVRLLATTLIVGPGTLVWLAESDRRVGAIMTVAVMALAGGFLWRLERLLGERARAEAELAHRASHDPLTGLANRARLLETIEEQLEGGGRRRPAAVMLLDLDDFKLVNDGMGHLIGDALLEAIAARLVAAVREQDVAARLGGDEFAIVCPDVPSAPTAHELAERLSRRLNGEYTVAGTRLHATASIGVAWSAAPQHTAEDLLARADAAMYAAKRAGRGRAELYRKELSAHAARQLGIATRLWRAADEGELRLHYQPELDLRTGGRLGAEALVRWEHPELGWLTPLDFLPVAEETGSIMPLGAWVLGEACHQAVAWQHDDPDHAPATMSVNVSARQLAHPGFVDAVQEALHTSGLAPCSLWLEVTETSVMHDPGHVADLLRQIKALGVGVAIDDFGTGYSSMAHLKHFPLDALKIDRSFVSHMHEDPRDRRIVQGVVGLAHALGLRAVAEGVELGEHLEALAAMDCDLAQGYLLGRPMPAETFGQWMRQPRLHGHAWLRATA